jgi:hypothetical protein
VLLLWRAFGAAGGAGRLGGAWGREIR